MQSSLPSPRPPVVRLSVMMKNKTWNLVYDLSKCQHIAKDIGHDSICEFHVEEESRFWYNWKQGTSLLMRWQQWIKYLYSRSKSYQYTLMPHTPSVHCTAEHKRMCCASHIRNHYNQTADWSSNKVYYSSRSHQFQTTLWANLHVICPM